MLGIPHLVRDTGEVLPVSQYQLYGFPIPRRRIQDLDVGPSGAAQCIDDQHRESWVDGLYLTDDFLVLLNDSPNFVRCGPLVARHTVGLRSVHSLHEQVTAIVGSCFNDCQDENTQ